MERWKEEIREAYTIGRTIQANHNGREWTDFVPQNQVDFPNLNYGTQDNWRIKPTHEEEREEILRKSGAYTQTPMMMERLYTKDEMLMFGGFCAAKHKEDPTITGEELWNSWNNFE